MYLFFWNVRIFFFWHYLPSPIKVFPSNSTEILKVGIWTGPSWPTTLYSMPGFSSFKAKHGLFMGWNAGLVLPGDFFLFDLLLPGLWSSGKCGFLSAPPPFFSGPLDLKSIDSYERKESFWIILTIKLITHSYVARHVLIFHLYRFEPAYWNYKDFQMETIQEKSI